MIKQFFKLTCVALGIAGLAGCSDNVVQPVSLDADDLSTVAKVGTTGASFVSSGSGPVYAVSKTETWPGGAHKIFVQSGTNWIPMIDFAHIDAWKVALDPGTGELWIIATNKTLWRGVNQQFFTPDNNVAGKTGPIKAYDLTMGEMSDRGVTYGSLFILLDETDTYGYVIWHLTAVTSQWSRYLFSSEASGVAIAVNPNNNNEVLWVVRNNGQLWRWDCTDRPMWANMASDCPSTFGKADVSVATDNSVYYLKNTKTGSDYYIKISTNAGSTWVTRGSGIALGASDKGWTVNASGNIYKYRGYLSNGSYWKKY